MENESLTKNNLVEKSVLGNDWFDKIGGRLEKGASVLITGQTGTGKTALLNSLSEFIPDRVSVLVIEDSSGEVNVKDNEGTYFINDRDKDSFKEALKRNPEMIIADEVLHNDEMLIIEELVSGTSGLTTVHSSNADDALERIYFHISEDLTHDEKLTSIQRAFDLIIVVGLEKAGDGEYVRKVIDVKEISKDLKKTEDGVKYIELLDIYRN